MMNDSSTIESKSEVMLNQTKRPKAATLNFIRQFARTYVAIPGCALGGMMMN